MNRPVQEVRTPEWTWWLSKISLLLLVLLMFLVMLELMGEAFRLLGNNLAQEILSVTSNPFVGLFIGLLSTAIIQSSSATTAMIVAVVAAGSLSLENAVPMVMGANIGTTLTCMLVAIGYVMDVKEFRRGFAIAATHNFFNILVAIILFPLEYSFRLLSNLAQLIAQSIGGLTSEPVHFFALTVRPIAEHMARWLNYNVWLIVILSAVGLFISIKSFSYLIKGILIDGSSRYLESILFNKPVPSLFFGILFTAAFRSSSLSISLAIPLVAAERVSVKKAFPFVLGANIGTTITAVLAAIARSDAALSIALVHVLFNVIGVLIFFPVPLIRNIPVFLAKTLGNMAAQNRLVSFGYVVFIFFLLPFVLIYSTGKRNEANRANLAPIIAPVSAKVKARLSN